MGLGCSMLWKKPKQAPKGEPRKAEMVTDPETIRKYLDGELDHDEHEYYFITTEKPDTFTIRGMFDRTFDKPAQRTEVTGEGGQPLLAGSIVNFLVSQQPGSENQT